MGSQMKIKFAVLNSMYDRMFDVEVDGVYVNAIAPKLIDSYDVIYRDGEYVNGPTYKAMMYSDFKKIAEDIYI